MAHKQSKHTGGREATTQRTATAALGSVSNIYKTKSAHFEQLQSFCVIINKILIFQVRLLRR
jgi:hypothetical protein